MARSLEEATRETWPDSKRELSPGTSLLGRFEIERKLGEGGMGMVFSARDTARQSRVALKILGELSPDSIRQIKREFRTAAELVHPNLVRIHELFSDGTEWFFTMDLVDGVSFQAMLDRHPDTRVELIRSVLRQLAVALHELHRMDTLHGDLKPSNFLISELDQRVVLLDFGLSRPLGPLQKREFAGTPAYMSPEQAMGHVLTEAADWYSFGVVLYEALTGELPLRKPSARLLEQAPADLAELCRGLLALMPGDRPGGAEVIQRIANTLEQAPLSLVGPIPRPLLVGRGNELARLEAAFEGMTAGQPSIVLIKGPSGIGKTALAEQFVDVALRHGAQVLKGRCRERESMGYKAVDGLIDDIVTFFDGMPADDATALLPDGISELTILFPALRVVPEVAAVSVDFAARDQRAVRERAITAFQQFLSRLRRRAPLVIWLDDLQWSDEESALLLSRVLAGSDPVPLLLIASYRSEPEGKAPLLDALLPEPGMPAPVVLDVGPLAREDAERLALRLLPAHLSEAASLARSIQQEAAGHPLFIVELAYATQAVNDSSRPTRPSSIPDLVARRVDALDPVTRGFLEVAAVAGAPCSRSTLRRAQGLTPSEAEEAIDILKVNRLARSSGLRESDSVDTQHDRIREVVIQRLDGERRKHCHLALARIFEVELGEKPEIVAAHYEGAGKLGRAARYWFAGADQAFKALAFQHAADLYARGMKLAELSPSEQSDYSIKRAEALACAGKGVQAADLYLETAGACAADLALELRRRAAEQLLLSGHLDRGMQVIEDVLSVLGMPKTRSGRRALLALLTGRLLVLARGLRHVPRTESEVPKAELARVDASFTIACSLSVIDFIRGADFQNRHLLLALRAGEPKRLLRALTLEISYAATPGAGSEKRSARLLKVADGLAPRGDHAATSLLCLTRGIAAYLQGNIGASLNHCEDALRIITRHVSGAVWETVTAQRFAIASLFFLGRLRRLAEFVPPLLTEAETTGNLYATMCFRAAYSAAAWLAHDNVAEARRQLARVRDEWKAPGFQLSHYNLLIGETFVDLYVDDAERARARIVEQWPSITAAQFLRVGVLRVQLWHFRAATACAAANAAEARGHLARARELRAEARKAAHRLERDPMRRASALAALVNAAVDRAEGDRESARRRFVDAARAFDEQGLRLFAAAARMRLGELTGGERGEQLVRSGTEEFLSEGVLVTERMLAVHAPSSSATACAK